MKKILFVLAMVMMSVCSFGQYYTVVDVPLSVEYGMISAPQLKEDSVIKTFTIDKLVKSKVVNRAFMTDKDNSVLTILTLEDGHEVTISVANNLTLVNDIIGSDYYYYTPDTIMYHAKKYDTIYVEVYGAKYVNLALLKVKSEIYIDNKTHYSAKVYSYSLDKAFWVETNKSFYEKHENDKHQTKKKVKNNPNKIEYKDYKMFLNFVYDMVGCKGYNFIETPLK